MVKDRVTIHLPQDSRLTIGALPLTGRIFFVLANFDDPLFRPLPATVRLTTTQVSAFFSPFTIPNSSFTEKMRRSRLAIGGPHDFADMVLPNAKSSLSGVVHTLDQLNFERRVEDVDLERHPKKRKLKSLVSSYEFAPRLPAQSAAATSAPRQSFGGRNSLTDWTERETFVLLEAWGDRFLQRGKKSLRSEEWQEVAEKVSEVSKIERTDTQCRNRLDTLKKKYKKEKIKFVETNGTSKWVYFKKMDMLMSSPQQQAGLSCGLDSGEYVFMNPRVYLNRANGSDEMRDSPGNSESAEGDDDDSDGLPPKKRKYGRESEDGSSFRLLADSIRKFSDIYEKIENSKRQQMVELEKMRMEFHRELEMQKRQIMERAQAEIAKIRQGDDEENDVSADNASG
ncbi:hypothetical protein FEM48_Zijuj01G0295400 [Ziziphus jujuba var. spinosa]|uniref:Myb-like domain-containing protein n=1 Tax=Ziziphus jujuba var. spinosa TaxID=714518 RepID=A0A978W5R9_ZIZJJ|nr:hypothetical protein FEM48_Zijuj01G0295400 [Ziziphus jujuba var. spinosa]